MHLRGEMMSLGLKYKNGEHIFEEIESTVPYLSFKMFRNTGLVTDGFSTRVGGVSEGCFSSLNLSFDRGDEQEAVAENFRRIGDALGVRCEDMVLSRQTHTTNIRIVTDADRGKGITRDRDYTDIDGLITNVPGICLVTTYADCVPLYFLDPVKRIIALSHSGWRGTVGKIGKKTVELMQKHFGSDPADILAAVGPSVCMECYEVSSEVIDQFKEAFDRVLWREMFYEKSNGKFQLDLWKANENIFLEAGISQDHIAMTNVCTHCNSEILYSHRAMGDKRGNLCAFLALK